LLMSMLMLFLLAEHKNGNMKHTRKVNSTFKDLDI
jgi:hypothetical protein